MVKYFCDKCGQEIEADKLVKGQFILPDGTKKNVQYHKDCFDAIMNSIASGEVPRQKRKYTRRKGVETPTEIISPVSEQTKLEVANAKLTTKGTSIKEQLMATADVKKPGPKPREKAKVTIPEYLIFRNEYKDAASVEVTVNNMAWPVASFHVTPVSRKTIDDIRKVIIYAYLHGAPAAAKHFNCQTYDVYNVTSRWSSKGDLKRWYRQADDLFHYNGKDIDWRKLCQVYLTNWKKQDIASEFDITTNMVDDLLSLFTGIKPESETATDDKLKLTYNPYEKEDADHHCAGY